MSLETRIHELAEQPAPRTIDPASVVDSYRARRRKRAQVIGAVAAGLLLVGGVSGGVLALRPGTPATIDTMPLIGTGYPMGPGCPPGGISLMNGTSTNRLSVVHVQKGETIALDLRQDDSGYPAHLSDITVLIGSPGYHPGTASFPEGTPLGTSVNVLSVISSPELEPHVELAGIDRTGRFPIIAMYHFTYTSTSPSLCQTQGLGTAVGQIGTLEVR